MKEKIYIERKNIYAHTYIHAMHTPYVLPCFKDGSSIKIKIHFRVLSPQLPVQTIELAWEFSHYMY